MPSQYTNAGPHAHPLFDGLTLARCRRCDSMWCPSSPTGDELGNYYEKVYTPANLGHVAKDRWPIWDTRPASLITLARMFTDWQPGDGFVDIGPGNGAALSLAPLLLPDPQLGCVEFSQTSTDYFRRHAPDIRITQSLDEFSDQSTRIVYSAHSLEHHRPDEALDALRSVRRVLVDGRALALEVPFAPSARTLVANRHTPHLLFFSREGLRRILVRAGFRIDFICTVKGRAANKKVLHSMDLPESLSLRLRHRLTALNSGDFIASIPSEGEPIRGAIKIVAVKGGSGLSQIWPTHP